MNTHGHFCDYCKKFIKRGSVDSHFDKHQKIEFKKFQKKQKV